MKVITSLFEDEQGESTYRLSKPKHPGTHSVEKNSLVSLGVITPKDNDDLIDETKSDMHVLSYCEDNLKVAQETTFKSDWQLGLFPGPISIEMVHVEQDVDFDDELQRSVGG